MRPPHWAGSYRAGWQARSTSHAEGYRTSSRPIRGAGESPGWDDEVEMLRRRRDENVRPEAWSLACSRSPHGPGLRRWPWRPGGVPGAAGVSEPGAGRPGPRSWSSGAPVGRAPRRPAPRLASRSPRRARSATLETSSARLVLRTSLGARRSLRRPHRRGAASRRPGRRVLGPARAGASRRRGRALRRPARVLGLGHGHQVGATGGSAAPAAPPAAAAGTTARRDRGRPAARMAAPSRTADPGPRLLSAHQPARRKPVAAPPAEGQRETPVSDWDEEDPPVCLGRRAGSAPSPAVTGTTEPSVAWSPSTAQAQRELHTGTPPAGDGSTRVGLYGSTEPARATPATSATRRWGEPVRPLGQPQPGAVSGSGNRRSTSALPPTTVLLLAGVWSSNEGPRRGLAGLRSTPDCRRRRTRPPSRPRDPGEPCCRDGPVWVGKRGGRRAAC